jgi:hypothetical protein
MGKTVWLNWPTGGLYSTLVSNWVWMGLTCVTSK